MATKLENNEVFLEDIEKKFAQRLLDKNLPSVISYEEYIATVKELESFMATVSAPLRALSQSTLDSFKAALN